MSTTTTTAEGAHTVAVTFYAKLRQMTGTKSVEIHLPPGATLRRLLNEVIGRYPQLGPALMDNTGQLHPYVHVFLSGRDVPYLSRGLDTPIGPADSVAIFPPVGGG